MMGFYIFPKRFFLKLKRLSDARVVSSNKKRIWFSSKLSVKSSKLIYGEWLNTIFRSSRLLEFCIIKHCAIFSLTSFGSVKQK